MRLGGREVAAPVGALFMETRHMHLVTEEVEALDNLVKEIEAFSRICEEEEYTDTGDAWTLLNEIKETIRNILP